MDSDVFPEEDCRFDNIDQDEFKMDKKFRKRKKKLYQAVKAQMEFYFSDSNLLKDKFLSKLINSSEDGSICVSVFLRFNKIRALTDSVQDIASSLSSSELLKVSEDGTKIKRTKPIVEKEDVDECTVYVEHLPSHTDHEWLTNVFSSFGTINYISLPRYKHTGKLKGFAFIEFDVVEAAEKACKHFGTLLNSSPHQNVENIPSEIEPPENSGKRKRDTCISESNDDDGVKRAKTDLEEKVDSSKEVEKKSNDKKHKKKRKRKKKVKAEVEEEPLTLRVMSKVEWKRWRNKYLSLQKATTAQIKKSLLGENFPSHRNFTPTHHQEEIEEPEKTVKTLEFKPGVIVHMYLDQPLSSLSDFKKQARAIANIAYIDAAEGDGDVYIRCSDSDAANDYIRYAKSNISGEVKLLEGHEEQMYWDKIEKDRENKFLSKTKQKKRGIEKLMTKAEKIVEKNRHIRFEDD